MLQGYAVIRRGPDSNPTPEKKKPDPDSSLGNYTGFGFELFFFKLPLFLISQYLGIEIALENPLLWLPDMRRKSMFIDF